MLLPFKRVMHHECFIVYKLTDYEKVKRDKRRKKEKEVKKK
jgi:hypothetical protein